MRGRQLGARPRSGRNPMLLLWVLIAATAMASAGCGNFSLDSALRNEAPGEFRLSPETVNVQVGGTFTFSASGGFTPYDYQVVSGLGDVVKDQTWVYEAPTAAITDPPYYIEVLIQATDQLGDSDTATVRVFNPFNIAGSTVRIVQIPNSITIDAAGGVLPYGWSVDGTADPAGTDPYLYAPTAAGIHMVGVTDFLGNYAQVMVIVLPSTNAPLIIYPDSVAVELGGKVSFEAYGGKPQYNWVCGLGSLNKASGTPVLYTAAALGTDTVTLTDSASPSPASVTATVIITAGAILPLVLSPEAPTVKAIGDQVQFSVTGGVPPYTFSSAPPGFIDSSGLYTQTSGAHKKVNVMVKDSAGSSDVTTVYYVP